MVDKLTEMICMAETCWACSLACSCEGRKTPSEAYGTNPLLANVTKLNIARMGYEWMRIAHDLAGCKIITRPSEKDINNPNLTQILVECFKGKENIDVMNISKMLRLIENMSVGAGLPEAMHGAGSPAAQKIMIARRSDINGKRALAETICGISIDADFEKIVGKRETEYWDTFKAAVESRKS